MVGLADREQTGIVGKMVQYRGEKSGSMLRKCLAI